MSLLELFRFLVPYFDSVPDADVQAALDFAAANGGRPECLTPAGQDAANVWYAAALLYSRSLQTAAAGAPVVPVGVKSEKEGDLQRTYGSADGMDASDPFGWWSKFLKLAASCTGGAITVGTRSHGCCPPPWACC